MLRSIKKESKHITALRSSDLRSATWLIDTSRTCVRLPLILCQAAASVWWPYASPDLWLYALRLLCLHAASDNLSAPRTVPFCMYTNTSAPSPSSAIAFTPNVISAIIHPEDSLRTSIPESRHSGHLLTCNGEPLLCIYHPFFL